MPPIQNCTSGTVWEVDSAPSSKDTVHLIQVTKRCGGGAVSAGLEYIPSITSTVKQNSPSPSPRSSSISRAFMSVAYPESEALTYLNLGRGN